MNTRDESLQIIEITIRAMDLGIAESNDFIMLKMDLEIATEQYNMDLKCLMEYNDYNFAHDISGIQQHINRKTKEMNQLFQPRCAKEVQYQEY